MPSIWPGLTVIVGALGLNAVHFFKKTKEEDIFTFSQGKIADVLLRECVMLNHFVSARTISKRHRLDFLELECVLEDFVCYGILERRYRKFSRTFVLSFYRRRLSPAQN